MRKMEKEAIELARKHWGDWLCGPDDGGPMGLMAISARALYFKGLSLMSGRTFEDIDAALSANDRLAAKASDLAEARAADGCAYQPHCIRYYAGALGEGWGES